MFERELTKQIEFWKKGVRKPLIVRGIRQVGKTTTILDFCKNNYDFVAYIDFRSDPSFSEIFEGDFDWGSRQAHQGQHPIKDLVEAGA